MQGASCTSGASWGLVSCSRTLQYAVQLSLARASWDLNQRPYDH